jgi:hypothetical protein
MNAAGQTAFQGRAGVDSLGDSGIWATDVNGTLQLVVRAGDTLEVAPADFRTIWYVDFVADSQGETGNEDGRASGFNDRGQIAFEAHFTDGTSGIFVSDAVLNDGVLPGDFNRDGVVDGADYVAWRKIDGENPAGYNIWRANLGRTSDGTDLASTAPEASSLLLIVLGVSAVASVHRSRRAS